MENKHRAFWIVLSVFLFTIGLSSALTSMYQFGYTRGQADADKEWVDVLETTKQRYDRLYEWYQSENEAQKQKAQIWEDALDEATGDFFIVFETYEYLKKYYVDKLPPKKELADAAAKGMVEYVGDPYVIFYPYKEVEEARERSIKDPAYANPNRGRLGFQWGPSETVKEVEENSPAQKAGLKEGDVVTHVLHPNGNWVEVKAEKRWESFVLISGLPGTEVSLKVRRGEEELIVTAERRLLENEHGYPAYGYLVSEKVGYIRIDNFNDEYAYAFTKTFLEALVSQGAEVLILDLRYNPGGYSRAAILVADELLAQGTLLGTVEYKDETRKHYAEFGRLTSETGSVSGGRGVNLELLVLVNNDTASAAEMLAGALKDNGRGVLIGTVTYGKGFGTLDLFLSDGSMLKVKALYWETPSGASVNGVGLAPDIFVPDYINENGSIDIQLKTALNCAELMLEGRECK